MGLCSSPMSSAPSQKTYRYCPSIWAADGGFSTLCTFFSSSTDRREPRSPSPLCSGELPPHRSGTLVLTRTGLLSCHRRPLPTSTPPTLISCVCPLPLSSSRPVQSFLDPLKPTRPSSPCFYSSRLGLIPGSESVKAETVFTVFISKE